MPVSLEPFSFVSLDCRLNQGHLSHRLKKDPFQNQTRRRQNPRQTRYHQPVLAYVSPYRGRQQQHHQPVCRVVVTIVKGVFSVVFIFDSGGQDAAGLFRGSKGNVSLSDVATPVETQRSTSSLPLLPMRRPFGKM